MSKTKYVWITQERVSNIAYNITNGLCTPISDQSAPVYVTIGDGGNLEGLVTEYVFFTFMSNLFISIDRKVSEKLLAGFFAVVQNDRTAAKLLGFS